MMILMAICGLIAFVFIVFSRDSSNVFLGGIILAAISATCYLDHVQNIEYEYSIERFKSGDELDCGLFKGSSYLVSRKRGWEYKENIGYIKGDIIVGTNHCSVIGKESEPPSFLPYIGLFILFMGASLILRSWIGIKAIETRMDKQRRKEADDAVVEQ